MQERNVLILVVVLVVATAGAGVAVNAFRNNASTFEAFYLNLRLNGTAAVGSDLRIVVSVQQAFIDSRTLPSLFLSVDVGSLTVRSATPGTNPWGSPTV